MMPYALGVTIGALMWNGLFLALSALGIISGETAWLFIKIVLGAAAAWVWTSMVLARPEEDPR